MDIEKMANKIDRARLAILAAQAQRNADSSNKFPQVDQNSQYDFVSTEEELEILLKEGL